MSTDQTENFETSIDIPDKVTVTLKKNMLAVSGPLGKTFKNFRKIPVSLEVKDNNILTGPVLSEVSQSAAEIEQKSKIKNKDHRVFLDGIYIYSKSKGIEK